MKVETLLNIMHNFDETKNLSRNIRNIDMTFSHILHIFHDLKKSGVLTIERSGRENVIRLTPEGKNLRIIVLSLRDKFKELGVVE